MSPLSHNFSRKLRRHRTEEEEDDAVPAQKQREEAIRVAKIELKSLIRDDFAYDNTVLADQSASPPISISRQILDWRQREAGSSTPESDSQRPADPYKFDSPDAVQDSIRERRQKRRKVTEEELEWNRGMRIWTERRNLWTGGKLAQRRSRLLYQPSGRRQNKLNGAAQTEHQAEGNADPTSLQSSSDEGPVELIPVAPRILPDNPIRTNIVPASYPSIYSKVVLQGLNPSVPINLLDMTRALVQGWKDDGQWPPKPTPAAGQEAMMFRKRNQSSTGNKVRRSVGAVRKVLGLSGSGSGSAQSKDSGKDAEMDDSWKKI